MTDVSKDINILELRTRNRERTHLRALYKAEGVNVGSTLIDWQAKKMVKDRLRALNVNGDDAFMNRMADDMMNDSGFEAFKRAFGDEMEMDIYMSVPEMRVDGPTRGRGARVVITP